MKNQYFGDINDYKKYGLLRAIIDETDLTVLVNWMLTPDDSFRRIEWCDRSRAFLGGTDLVFLDPDNGLEVSSVPYGRKRSSKYLY